MKTGDCEWEEDCEQIVVAWRGVSMMCLKEKKRLEYRHVSIMTS